MPAIDTEHLRAHFEARARELREDCKREIADALEEIGRRIPDPAKVEASLLGALMALGECRGFQNAIYDVQQGEVPA